LENSDYYNILDLESTAGPEEIRIAYRELALKHHPDRNRNDVKAAEKMKKINEAYAVLSDPEKKREYDELRKQYGRSGHSQFRQSYSDKDIFEGSDIHHVFEEISRSFGLRGGDEIFRGFYGPGYKKRFKFTGPGFFGAGFFFFGMLGKGSHRRLPLLIPGLGRLAGVFLDKLTDSRAPRRGKNIYDMVSLSPDLAKTGGPYAYYHRKKNKKLVVKIPPGVRNGQQIRLAGIGGDGKGGGGPGDLYLRVSIYTPLITKTKNLLSSFLKKR
jgi:DnaJ-class molecular chaperone